MSGIFSGFSDSITGGGGAPGSQVNDIAVQDWINNALADQMQARLMAGQSNTRYEDQFRSQQNLLPFIYQQLGYSMDRTGGAAGNEVGNFRYEGTEAQNSLDQLARQGFWSMPAQYANAGYDYRENPDGGVSVDERGDSQRNQFVDAQGRSVADAERMRAQAIYGLTDPNGAGQQAVRGLGAEFGQAQSVRDQALRLLNDPNGAGQQAMAGAQQSLTGSQGVRNDAYQNFLAGQGTGENLYNTAYQNLLARQGTGDNLYNAAYGNLQNAQGTQNEAMDAIRRQLQTAEGLQAPALDRLGITRDASGNFSNDPNSNMGQYDANLRQQTDLARGAQGWGMHQLGYYNDASGQLQFDPNAAGGGTRQSYQNLMRQSQDEVGTSQQLRDAELGRLGMMRDAQGQWGNDPNSNEMRARGLQGDFLTRAKMGMEGTAPINPGLQRQLAQEEQQLREGLIRQMGPGYDATSPGMEALANFSKRRSELMYTEQQDAMNTGVNQAINLQGSNLQTLASLYGISEPVLRAIAGATNVSNSATASANQTNATNAQVMGQLQQNVLNPITTASNVNAQTLASLYGLTQPALAASGQLGIQGVNNQNANTNAYGQLNTINQSNQTANNNAYGQLNTINQANQASNRAGYAGVSGMDVNSANIANLLQSMNLGNVGAYGQVSNMGANAANISNQWNTANLNNTNAYGQAANIGQDAINNRAQGAINFQNSNAAVLGNIPQQQQQLYTNANNGRMAGVAAMYPAIASSFDQTQGNNLINLFGSLGSQGGQLGLGSASAVDQGNYLNHQTNINNIFWQNLMRSGGQFVGGGMGMGG